MVMTYDQRSSDMPQRWDLSRPWWSRLMDTREATMVAASGIVLFLAYVLCQYL